MGNRKRDGNKMYLHPPLQCLLQMARLFRGELLVWSRAISTTVRFLVNRPEWQMVAECLDAGLGSSLEYWTQKMEVWPLTVLPSDQHGL